MKYKIVKKSTGRIPTWLYGRKWHTRKSAERYRKSLVLGKNYSVRKRR